jgi:hypothetical protein
MCPSNLKNNVVKFFAGSVVVAAAVLLNGCTGVTVASQSAIAQATSASVSVVAQSTPSKTTSVQSLRVQVTSAVLSPGNVQLVKTPVTLDLANITTGSALLSMATAPAGTYTGLTITFSNPYLSITNTTGSSITLPSGACSAQSTCSFTPVLKNDQADVTTGVFPLILTAEKPDSFAVTMAVAKILQSDDSLDFSSGVDTGVDQTGTSGGTGATGNEPLDSTLGVVQSVANGQLVLLSESNDVSPSIAIDSATVFQFPSMICSANNVTCLAPGEIVVAALSLTSAGLVHADSISFADTANARLLEGTILSVSPANNSFQILVNKSFGFASGSSPDESSVTVTLQGKPFFGINSVGYPVVAGATFSNMGGMLAGQSVLVDISSTSQLPNVWSSQVLLTDSSTSGTISALGNGSMFTLTSYSAEQENTSPINSQVTVLTDAGTMYRNVSPANFSSLANGQSVSATGPLFNISPAPILAARQISLHSSTDQ